MTQFQSRMTNQQVRTLINYEDARKVFNKYRHRSNYDEINEKIVEQDGKRFSKTYLQFVVEVAKQGIEMNISEEWNNEVRRWAYSKRDQAMAQHINQS